MSLSKQAFERAKKVIPGGVNSPVRAFKSVDRDPVFIKRAKGSRIWDIDNNEYIDFVASWGPLIIGHAHEEIINAINNTAILGTSYGAPTELETHLATLIVEMVPSIEKVRMVNSGTEATMSALRLARGYTNRDNVIKFVGCYHGHGDSFLIKAGSGALTHGTPSSSGVTKASAQNTLLADFNNIASVEKLFQQMGDTIAAVIIEPVAGNMGVIPPDEGFLVALRNLCTRYGALLIFDEVMTGFRLSKGGAQLYYDVTPDITTLGKIIGGGLPVGAYGGKSEIMDMLSPDGPVYQAGTLSGNPLAMAAGIAMLTEISKPNFYQQLEMQSAKVYNGMIANINEVGIPAVVNRVGSMMTLFFTSNKKVTSYDDALTSDTKRYAKFFSLSLDAGIYLAPSQFEAMFVSSAHTDADIEFFLKANKKALQSLV